MFCGRRRPARSLRVHRGSPEMPAFTIPLPLSITSACTSPPAAISPSADELDWANLKTPSISIFGHLAAHIGNLTALNKHTYMVRPPGYTHACIKRYRYASARFLNIEIHLQWRSHILMHLSHSQNKCFPRSTKILHAFLLDNIPSIFHVCFPRVRRNFNRVCMLAKASLLHH